MFMGYSCYTTGLEYTGATQGKVHLAQLDEVKVAGCLSKEIQAQLAEVAPFAHFAWKMLNDVSFFLSHLKDKSSNTTDIPSVPTKGQWKEHLRKLKGWRVLRTLTGLEKPKVWMSKYFAILKSTGMARTIFSGGKLSSKFLRPPPVNLPSLPLVLILLSEIVDGHNVWFISADLRHYFHQIAISDDLVEFFTLLCHGELLGYIVLPMGFSFSPSIAQRFAWAALLSLASKENGLAVAAEEFLRQKPEHPPSFMYLHKDDVKVGLVVVWYDNFLIWSIDQSIINHLASTLKQMTKRWNLIWGKRDLWHPRQLLCTMADASPDVGTALGIQFAISQKRDRLTSGPRLVWRMKPSTAAKASALKEVSGWTCRLLAGLIGSAIWHCYISTEPMFHIHDVLELSAKVGKHAAHAGWNATIHTSAEDLAVISNALKRIETNQWFGDGIHHDWSNVTIIASDSTLRRGAWVRYTSSVIRAEWKSWAWTNDPNVDSSEKIFVLELRAAVRAITSNGQANGVVVIVLDNTAAASVLRSMYSKTRIGRELLRLLHQDLQRRNIFLVVAGIAGIDNDADSPTRGDYDRPAWSDKRLLDTWFTGVRALEGCERLRMNPNACGISHKLDEVEDEYDDEQFTDVMAEIAHLQERTDLEAV